MSKVTLGLLQHACTADPAANLQRPSPSPSKPLSAGRRSSARRNCFAPSISARVKTTPTSSWRSLSRARAPRRFKNSPGSTASSSSPRFSKNAPPGFITTPPSSSTRTARSSASTARCTSRTIRSSTRSSTSRLATPAFAHGRPSTAASACSSAGISGIPRLRA